MCERKTQVYVYRHYRTLQTWCWTKVVACVGIAMTTKLRIIARNCPWAPIQAGTRVILRIPVVVVQLGTCQTYQSQ